MHLCRAVVPSSKTLTSKFLRSPTDPAYLGATDVDGSNTIDSADLLQFTGNFLHSVPLMREKR